MKKKRELTNEKGELVCRNAAPCMPIYFLNDTDFTRYKSSYFKDGESKEWYHGDYIIVDEYGGIEILGRSDSTLNPGGVRIGTAEFYQILDTFTEINDSIVSSSIISNDEKIILFIKLQDNQELTAQLKKSIRYTLKEKAFLGICHI